MAEKHGKEAQKKPVSAQHAESPDKNKALTTKVKKTTKVSLIVLVLLLLVGAGFVAGVYLKLIDVPTLAERWKLYDYPIIGKYLPKAPAPVDSAAADHSGSATPGVSDTKPGVPATSVGNLPDATDDSSLKPKRLTLQDLEKLDKQRKQEEARRIGKLASYYGGMKPEEAVPILNNLDDDTVIAILAKMEEDQVAKLLAAMDAKRAARLTDQMFKGSNNSTTVVAPTTP